LDISTAVVMLVRATREPGERSICAVRITNVDPIGDDRDDRHLQADVAQVLPDQESIRRE